MAKKTTNSKIRTGSAKSKKSWYLTKRTALFSLVGVLAFSTVAGIGWQKWQDHQLRARAAGWKNIGSSNGAQLLACKRSQAGFWQVQFIIANGDSYWGATATVSISGPSGTYSGTLGAYPNTYSSVRYLFPAYPDTRSNYSGNIKTGGSAGGSGPVYTLPDC